MPGHFAAVQITANDPLVKYGVRDFSAPHRFAETKPKMMNGDVCVDDAGDSDDDDDDVG